MIRRTRNPDHSHTGRIEFLKETGPELRQVALIPREAQRTGLEDLSAIQDPAGLGRFKRTYPKEWGGEDVGGGDGGL